MDTFCWATEQEHANNQETMEQYLNEFLPDCFDIELHDGTYAEIKNKNTGHSFEVHASGNGDFRSHKVDFKFIQ